MNKVLNLVISGIPSIHKTSPIVNKGGNKF